MRKLALIIWFLGSFLYKVNAQVIQQDSLALVDLYNSTNGPNWFNHTNWLTGPVSSWVGIVLDPTASFIKEMYLDQNNLSEQLPASIGNFFAIYKIDLSQNNLSGQIPPEFGNLSSLLYLDLSFNQFSGSLIWDNANLQNLEFLYLYVNNLSGAFPIGLINGIIHVVGIKYNRFTYIPDYSSQLQTVDNFLVAFNNLDFASLEPNLPLFNFLNQYEGQDSVLTALDTTVIQGSSLVLHSKVGGTTNMYLWTKNDADLLGEVDSNLVLNNITFADSGWYSCNINNQIINNLTLHRKKIHVRVIDSVMPVVPIINPIENLHITWNNKEQILNLDVGSRTGYQAQAALFNLQGQKVKDLFRGIVRFPQYHYKLESLTPGIYVVRVESMDRVITKKLIIE